MATESLADSPWILLPGTLCTSAVFDGFLDALGVDTARRHTVQLDQPSVAHYRATFDDLPKDAIVCGFSLGGIVAAHHADRMKARALILFGLNPHGDDPDKAQSRHELAQDVARHGGAAALGKRNIEVFGPAPDATRAGIYAMADATANLIGAQTHLALSRPGALPALANARVPVFSLTGSRDNSAPVSQGRAAARAAPQGRFHGLEGLGHFAVLEDPEACAKAVLQMMDDQDDPR